MTRTAAAWDSMRGWSFYVLDHEEAEDAILLPGEVRGKPFEEALLADAAELCAEHYHAHGGWEASWPVVIVILSADGTEVGRVEVDREMVPEFMAGKVTLAGAQAEERNKDG